MTVDTMPSRVLERIWGRKRRVTVDNAAVPPGIRVYAIGDIHGRADLLQRLHEMISVDAKSAAPGTENIVVYLGDYLDRGLNSKDLIDYLLDQPLSGFTSVYLCGNHDQHFLDFLGSPEIGGLWLKYGGDATVYSYGVRIPDDVPADKRLEHIRDRLLEVVPKRHLAFLSELKMTWTIGDYLFVHAGISPDKAIDKQEPHDLLWIRDEFLESEKDFGKVVIHGHSMTEAPDICKNRIGVDTGACYSNILTCVVLQEDTKRFISTEGS
jgi:serine/threonine protein phosphatase 1